MTPRPKKKPVPRLWAGLPPAGHPLWPIVRVVVSTTALTGFLYANATNFDRTEGKSIGGVFVVNLLLEGLGMKRKT